jgi:hypothetical protein
MFKVYEMSGNFSKEVAMFETESEASEFVCSKVEEFTIEQLPSDYNDDDYEMEYENQMSYFSIEDDGRELISHDDLIEQYDNMLDDCYPEMFNMCASVILERADPIQYSCGLNDYYDSICDSYYCEEME